MYLKIEKLLCNLVKRAYNEIIKVHRAVSKQKSKGDIVTNNDLATEKFIINEFLKVYPNTNVISEEYNTTNELDDKPTLVIDPIDGTTNYAHGLDLWGIQVAYCENKEPVASVIYFPTKKLLVSATKGMGLRTNGKSAVIKDIVDFRSTLCFEGDDKRLDEYYQILTLKFPVNIRSRIFGCSSFAYVCTALGYSAGIFKNSCKYWDDLPGLLLCYEAGCRSYKKDKYMIVTKQDWIYNIIKKELDENF